MQDLKHGTTQSEAVKIINSFLASLAGAAIPDTSVEVIVVEKHPRDGYVDFELKTIKEEDKESTSIKGIIQVDDLYARLSMGLFNPSGTQTTLDVVKTQQLIKQRFAKLFQGDVDKVERIFDACKKHLANNPDPAGAATVLHVLHELTHLMTFTEAKKFQELWQELKAEVQECVEQDKYFKDEKIIEENIEQILAQPGATLSSGAGETLEDNFVHYLEYLEYVHEES